MIFHMVGVKFHPSETHLFSATYRGGNVPPCITRQGPTWYSLPSSRLDISSWSATNLKNDDVTHLENEEMSR